MGVGSRANRNQKVPRAQALEKSIEILKTAQAEARSRIQVGKLVSRMQGIANGEVKGEAALLSVQRQAAKDLLAFCLPVLSSVEQDVKVESSVHITVELIR
jgi:uncharacterized protein YcsI (UPF0317 family)